MKKKKIISVSRLLVFLFIFTIFNIIVFFVCVTCPIFQERISVSSDVARSITSFQITISLVSITIMILFLGSTNERIMGISYKKIFFNEDFFRFFNVTNCVFLMLAFIVFSIVSSNILVNIEYSKVSLFGKIVCEISLFCSILLMFYMVTLGLILKYKQSRIYYKIYKGLKNKKVSIYDEIIEKISIFEVKENEYQQYIIEEFIILSYICLNIRDFESNIREQEQVLRRIISKIRNMIEKDPRDNSYLLIKLYKEAEKAFKKDDAKDLFCCTFYE